MSDEVKIYVTPDKLRLDSFKLAVNVVAGDFRPNQVLVLLRGAASIGNYVHELLSRVYGFKLGYSVAITSRIPITDGYYVNIQALLPQFTTDTRLLIIDDIFDTGSTIDEMIRYLGRVGLNESCIRTAVVDYKPGKNTTQRLPDYYVNESPNDTWIVYPHEISDVTDDAIPNVFGMDVANLLLVCDDLLKLL